VVAEELGRALTPSPFFATLQGSLAILHGGTDTQRKEMLPAVAAGRRVLSFAITEESGTENADEMATRAAKSGAGWTLAGTKLFVPDAQNADAIVVAARSGGAGEGGISLFVVERGAPGLTITPLRSMDQTRRIAECAEAHPRSCSAARGRAGRPGRRSAGTRSCTCPPRRSAERRRCSRTR
jgi:alkylation response protein AidB-like acyl-CoA dehydrogenase